MGGNQSSRSHSSVFMKSLTDIAVTNLNECINKTAVEQNIKIVGNGNLVEGIKQVQTTNLSLTCDQDSNLITNLQNQLTAKLSQAAKDNDVALLNIAGKSSAQVEVDIKNDVSNFLKLENIQKIVNQVNTAQDFSIRGNNNIVRNVSQEQAMNMFAGALQKSLSKLDSVQKVDAAVNAKAETTVENPISQVVESVGNALSKVWSAISGPFVWLAILLILVVAGYLISGMFGSGDTPPNPAFMNAAMAAKLARQRFMPGQPGKPGQPVPQKSGQPASQKTDQTVPQKTNQPVPSAPPMPSVQPTPQESQEGKVESPYLVST